MNGKGKNLKSRKETFLKKLDKLFDIIVCKCEITTCEEKGCPSDCKKFAHIDCDCLRPQKIPPIELSFVKDQRLKVDKGQLRIGGVDAKETERLETQYFRKYGKNATVDVENKETCENSCHKISFGDRRSCFS